MHVYNIIFFYILLSILRFLKVLVTGATDNDIVHLEDHAAELRGEHELLLLSDQRIDDKGLLHVVGALVHAVDAELAAAFGTGPHLLGLDLSERGNRVETAVLGERHGDSVESLGERAHGVLLKSWRLHSSVLDS